MESVLADLTLSSGAGAQRTRILAIAAVAIVAIAATILLNVPSTTVRLVPLGIAGLALLSWVLVRANQDPKWLVGCLLVVSAASQTALIDGASRAIGHYGLVFALCLTPILKVPRAGMLRRGGFRLYGLYYLWGLITVAYSLAPAFSIGRLVVSVAAFLALAFAAGSAEDREDVRRLMAGFVTGCAIVAVLLVASLVVLPHNIAWAFHPEWGVERFQGFFAQCNQVGELAVTAVGATLFLWTMTDDRRTKVGLAVLVVMFTGLDMLADSRTSFVSVGVGFTTYVIWRYRWRGVLACAALAAFIAIGIAVLIPDLRTYLVHRDVTTLTGRTDMWRFVIKKIGERPLFGYGYGVEGAIFQDRYFPIWWGPWQQGAYSSIHNGYLDTMVAVGIPAAALWLFTLVRPFVSIFRRREDPWNIKPLALLVMVPILVENLAESTTQDWRAPVGVLLFLSWALAERHRIRMLDNDARLRQGRLGTRPSGSIIDA